MRVEKFKVTAQSKVSNQISSKFPTIPYNQIMKLLRNKDIKINGKRISKDEIANNGDEIIFYISEEFLERKLDVVFQDENIIIINKPRKIEIETKDGNDLLSQVKKEVGQECYAVHRLDMNTTGLVIFAKNLEAKVSLDKAFKVRTIDKYYLTLVIGNLENKEDKMVAYLKKDNEKSFVKISNFSQKGYEMIETRYKLCQNYENFALIEVELITGKTHQIRAHFAHIGHPVLGDEKYGNSQINNIMKTKYQCLCSHKVKFNFDKNDYLCYLNGKIIELERKKIDFLKFCK